jgi:GDPmannose 4,6-dehydratase
MVRVRVDPHLFRPVEVRSLQGDASRAAEILQWYPVISFEEMVEEMVYDDLQKMDEGGLRDAKL